MHSTGSHLPLLQVGPATSSAVVFGVANSVQAGFPSPAENHAVHRLDLNEILIRHPLATYFMRVKGSSMRDAGIDDGDEVLVDREMPAVHGSIVVAVVDGEFTLKRLWRRGARVKLVSANPDFPDFEMSEGQTLEIWGVVTRVIKTFA